MLYLYMSYLRYPKLKYVLLFLKVLLEINVRPIRESRYSSTLRLSIFSFLQKEAQSKSMFLKMDSGQGLSMAYI